MSRARTTATRTSTVTSTYQGRRLLTFVTRPPGRAAGSPSLDALDDRSLPAPSSTAARASPIHPPLQHCADHRSARDPGANASQWAPAFQRGWSGGRYGHGTLRQGGGAGSASAARSHVWSDGWPWLALLRAGLSAAMLVFATTFREGPLRSGPAYLEPVAIALGLIPALLALIQVIPPVRRSYRVGVMCMIADAAVVLAFRALYAFEPGREPFGLIVLVQAEGGLVLGNPRSIWVWLVTSLSALAIEVASGAGSDVGLDVRQ